MSRLRKYKRISYEERKRIEKMYKNGVNVRLIAEDIGVAHTTLYRELKRGEGDDGEYNAELAQLRYGYGYCDDSDSNIV